MNKYWAMRQRDLLFSNELSLAEKELADQYLRCYEKTFNQISVLYDELLAGQVGSRSEILVSDLYRFDRYFQLMNQLQINLQILGSKEITIGNERLTNIYKTTSELIRTELGANKFSSLVDENQVKTVLNAVWCPDGKIWSDRIWSNKALLQESVKNGLVDCIARGVSKDELVKTLMKSFNTGFNYADRIARTELNFIQNQATADRYREAGVEKYQILSAHDDRTCDSECADKDGQIYLLKDMEVGVNYPPFHPNCRCAVLAVLD